MLLKCVYVVEMCVCCCNVCMLYIVHVVCCNVCANACTLSNDVYVVEIRVCCIKCTLYVEMCVQMFVHC